MMPCWMTRVLSSLPEESGGRYSTAVELILPTAQGPNASSRFLAAVSHLCDPAGLERETGSRVQALDCASRVRTAR